MLLSVLFISLCAASHSSHSHKHHDHDDSHKSPKPSPACVDCYEAPKQPGGGPFGACCFGDRSVGEDYTEATCAFTWAGVNTSASDCAARTPCCTAGKCTHEVCFDCAKMGGKQVKFCSETECPPVITTTTKPPHTHSSKRTKTEPPETTHTTHKHTTGCCCTTLWPPKRTTSGECHENGGFYAGDGASCNDQDVCQARCCDPVSRVCSECDNFEDWQKPTFIGFGNSLCCDNVCGVTCCINAKAVNADSARVCTRSGGTVVPNVAVEDAFCGGGCCMGLNFSIVFDHGDSCQAQDYNYVGDGVGFSPGICGGCGCFVGGGSTQIDESACNANPNCVFQGNDTICPTPTPAPTPPRKRTGDGGGDEKSSSSSDSHKKPPYQKNFTDLCANDGCCCYKAANGTTVKQVVRDSLACFELKGVWKGEGVTCDQCSCDGGVCCNGRAGYFINSQAECELADGVYAGDGTSLDMEGVCDHQGGACYCDPHRRSNRDDDDDDDNNNNNNHRKRDGTQNLDGLQCFEVPNATVCEQFGCGNSFQGVGTRCNSWGSNARNFSRGRGACCVPRQFNQDEHLCEIVDDLEMCQFLGGGWNGIGSKCEDDTCSAITGRCCTRDERGSPTCEDGVVAVDCHQDGGHWGGPHSLCSDQFACDPKHEGACCRQGCACSVTTPKVCHTTGGRFQGFATKCQDWHNSICKICMPCEVEAPSCSDAHPCKNPHTTCVREYGKCMVLATPILTYNDYEVSYSESSSSSSDSSDSDTKNHSVKRVSGPPPAPPPPSPSPAPEPTSEESSHTKLVSNVGPLSCGDKSTIGLPCLASPVLGKCRIGTCTAPPANSSFSPTCASVCWQIVEYECGCQCAGAWLKTCASINGRVIHDRDNDHKYNNSIDGLLGGATVRIAIAKDRKWHFVSQQTTSNKGHYAFNGLEPGKYLVSARFPGCFTSENSRRIVQVECLEMGNNSLRAHSHGLMIGHVHSLSVNLERREKATHLAENVDLFAVEDCEQSKKKTHNDKRYENVDEPEEVVVSEEEEPQQAQHNHNNHHHKGETKDKYSDRDQGLSPWAIAFIVLIIVLVCCCLVGLCWVLNRNKGYPEAWKTKPFYR